MTDNTQIQRVDLGAEGIARVRDEITEASWRPLGELLLKRELNDGSAWALVPTGIAEERLRRFEESLGPYDTDLNLGPALEDTIKLAMSAHGERAVLCMQTAAWNATDPWLKTARDARVFFCEEVVFDFARPGETLLETLHEGLWYPTCGMVTRIPESLVRIEPRDTISLDQLAEMANAANLLIVGAWDAEQPVFWEPPGIPV